MTVRNILISSALLFGSMAAGGCAVDGAGNPLTTSAVVAPEKTAAAKIDPACATLTSQIETLRKEGAVERLEKAAEGKGQSVQVKRASLAKQAELNKANADFQAKCSTQVPKAQSAQASPAAATTAMASTAGQKTASTAATAVTPAAAAKAAATEAAKTAAADAKK